MVWKSITIAILGACLISGCSNRSPAHVTQASGSTADPALLPGRQKDGSVLLPNQWSLMPAGRQIELGDFPVNIALHPGGRFAAILNGGYSAHEIVIVDVINEKIVFRFRVKEAFYGIEFSPDGTRLYCSGAGEELIHSYEFAEGTLINHSKIQLRDANQRGVPAGLAVDGAGKTVFAANVWGHRVSRVELAGPVVRDLPIGTNFADLLKVPITPSSDPDSAAADKRAEAALYQSRPEDTFPFACRLDEKRRRLYVSLWAQSSVAVLDLSSGGLLAQWPAEDHPCEMVLNRTGELLFVANANRNTVTVFNTDTGRKLETIWAALYPQSPPGSTPNSLALSPDERRLFVANACNNVVAVFDVSHPGKSRSLGFIPAGWYPTSVRVSADGRKLLVANGKGIIPKANPLGPQPGVTLGANRTEQYIGSLFRGTLGVIDLPEGKALEKQMAVWTAQALACSPLKVDASRAASRPVGNPVPQRIGDPSPIKYCIYIVKENRTYDQVLGDMPEGNGDSGLCLFPEEITPNHHQLAREFGLLDNFYVESEVSADGHEWSMGAYASDFVEKFWPLSYGHNGSGKFPYPSEGNYPIAAPAAGYLWDRASEAGVTYRSYGEFVHNSAAPDKPARAKVKSLEGHIDPWFRGFDMSYSDLKRAERFISELRRFESEGEMPRLQIVRLPNDHTHGATPGFLTPQAYVAQNDAALGQVIAAITRSKFWPQTAVFVVEDDAQNGPDHVDAHRTIAYVISPYSKRGTVDSTLYSTSSMLRTMELILGLRPMSQFDAAARPMFSCFQSEPDLRTYQALPARFDLERKNTRQAWGGDLDLDFTKEDAADDLMLNEIVWRSVRGGGSPMPVPVRAGFVFGHEED
jgi:DNA-binding beta-propeller fold protein YncE